MPGPDAGSDGSAPSGSASSTPGVGGPAGGFRGQRAGTIFRISLLLAGLVIVTILGVAIGRAVAPGTTGSPSSASPAPPSTPAATTANGPTGPAGPTTTASGPGATSSGSHKTTPTVRALVWGPLSARLVARLPVTGGRPGAAVSGTTLVVVGGATSNRVLAGKVGGKLATIATLPQSLAAAAAFSLNGAVYAVGGESGTSVSSAIYRVDVAGRKVVPAGTFVEPLAEAGVAAQGSSAYLVGGWTGSKVASAILKFSPTGNAAALLGRLPEGVRSPAVAIFGGKLIIAGGRTETGVSSKVYSFDLATGKVTLFGTLPQGVEQGSLVVAPAGLFLVGGLGANGKPVDSVIRIDPVTGYAVAAGTTKTPFAGAAAVTAGPSTLLVVALSRSVYRLG